MRCFLILAGCDSSFSPRWEGAELEARFLALGEVSEANAVLGVLRHLAGVDWWRLTSTRGECPQPRDRFSGFGG